MPHPADPDPFDDVDDGRDETPAERYDRNWNEVLQELRVLQTGTQILTGFLLALAFQPKFQELSEGQQIFYLVLVVLAALSSIIALAPVAVHRMLFRRRAKGLVVSYGHAALITALATVSVLLLGVVAFVFDVVVSAGASATAAAVLGVLIVLGWLIVPAMLRARRRERTRS
jgi:SNF family Na+-dependent transporter